LLRVIWFGMPAGVSTPTYLKFTAAALFSMFLGSQSVHAYYRPLADIEELLRKAEGKPLSEEEIKQLLKPAKRS